MKKLKNNVINWESDYPSLHESIGIATESVDSYVSVDDFLCYGLDGDLSVDVRSEIDSAPEYVVSEFFKILRYSLVILR